MSHLGRFAGRLSNYREVSARLPPIQRSQCDSDRAACWLRGCTVASVFVGSQMGSQAARNDKTAGRIVGTESLEFHAWCDAVAAVQVNEVPMVAIGIINVQWTGWTRWEAVDQ